MSIKAMTAEETPTKEAAATKDEGWQELMGKDLLMKVIESPSPTHEQGQKTDAVQAGDAVRVDFVGRVAAGRGEPDGPVVAEMRDQLLVVGEKDAVPALEMGIRFMPSVGSTAQIWSHYKFAYGAAARKWKTRNGAETLLPPRTNVLFTVTLRSVVSADGANEPKFQAEELCPAKKTLANDIYNHELIPCMALVAAGGKGAASKQEEDAIDYTYCKARALQLYGRAAELLEHLLQQQQARRQNEDDEGGDDEEWAFDTDAARRCLIDCLNNAAAVHMTVKDYHAAKEACVRVLQQDPDNFKALIRAAKASLLDPASSYEEVESAVDAAAEHSTNADAELVQKLKADFKRCKAAYRKRQKEMFSKMGEGMKDKTENAKEKEGPVIEEVEDEPNEKEEVRAKSPPSEEAVTAKAPPAHQTNSWMDWLKQLPWWSTILPYGFQLILPFITYYFFVKAKQKQRDRSDEFFSRFKSSSENDEF